MLFPYRFPLEYAILFIGEGMTHEKDFWETNFETIPYSCSMSAFADAAAVGMGVWLYLPDDDQERHFLCTGNSAQL